MHNYLSLNLERYHFKRSFYTGNYGGLLAVSELFSISLILLCQFIHIERPSVLCLLYFNVQLDFASNSLYSLGRNGLSRF